MSKPLQNDSQKMMDAVVKRFENPDEIEYLKKESLNFYICPE